MSPAWIEMARTYLEENVPKLGAAIEGVTFSTCEIFTDPPPHLEQDGKKQAAWYVSINGTRVEAGPGAPDGIERRMTYDYHQALPAARTVYSDDPALLERLAASRKQREQGGGRAIPDQLGRLFLGLHDTLARHTA